MNAYLSKPVDVEKLEALLACADIPGEERSGVQASPLHALVD